MRRLGIPAAHRWPKGIRSVACPERMVRDADTPLLVPEPQTKRDPIAELIAVYALHGVHFVADGDFVRVKE
jgi:hypothetical protein